MLVKMWNTRDTHSLLVGAQYGTATLKDSLVVSYKPKYTSSRPSIIHTLWYLSKGVENLCLNKNLTQMFRAALFIILKIWKQLRCASVGDG